MNWSRTAPALVPAAVNTRKPLKPETLADIARRLEILFDVAPIETR